MDPFSERDIIESLKSMAVSLRNIDRKLDDIALSLREFASSEEIDKDGDEIEAEEAKGSEDEEDSKISV